MESLKEEKRIKYPDEPPRFSGNDIEPFIMWCVKSDASDITIQNEEQIFCEIHGKMVKVTDRRLSKSEVSDLSLRRVRVKMTYKPAEKLMFVLQGGTTNVNMNAKASNYFDLLDAYAEYSFNDKIAFGAGRSTWRGLSRFSIGITGKIWLMPQASGNDWNNEKFK